MIETVISTLAAALTGVISATGYVGVALLMAVESACIPLPSEIIMPFAGSLVPAGRFSLIDVATAGAPSDIVAGAALGTAVSFGIASWLSTRSFLIPAFGEALEVQTCL